MKATLKRITTTDGLELVGLLYEPDRHTQKILVHVHGMEGNFYENPFLDAIAQTLTSNGIAFFAFNNRGCEAIKDLTQTVNGKKKLTRIGNAYEKFEDCVLDIGAAIDLVSSLGFSDIHLSGHSLGTPKVVYYLAVAEDIRVKSVLLLSPSDMLGLVRMDSKRFNEDIEEALEMAKTGNGRDLMSRQVWDECPVSADTYLSLFADDSRAAIFNFYDPDDQLEVLAEIRQPLFAIMGRKDTSIVIPIEQIFERIKKAAKNSVRVETKILGDANHGYYGDEQNLADEILKWVQI